MHYGIGSPALKLAALQRVCNNLAEVETLTDDWMQGKKNSINEILCVSYL